METSDTPPIIPNVIQPRSANKMGIFRWGGLGLLIGFIVGLFLANISWILFFASLGIFTILLGYHGAKTKTTEERLKANKATFVSDEPLDKREKIVIWIFSFAAPVICGGALYYMWRYKYPTKAKQANKISWIAFAILIPVGIALNLLASANP